MKFINFSNSFIKWSTLKENSIGRFSIESILEQGEEIYFLCNGVFAGNVYDLNDPVQVPTYWYQITFSKSGKYKIFRIFNDRAKNKDEIGEIENRFDKLSIETSQVEVSPLETTKEIALSIDNYEKMLARIEYIENSQNIHLSFPIKHLNYSPRLDLFQIETGPILIGEQSSNNGINLNLAYLFINSFHSVSFLSLEEINLDKRLVRRYSNITHKKADVKIFKIKN